MWCCSFTLQISWLGLACTKLKCGSCWIDIDLERKKKIGVWLEKTRWKTMVSMLSISSPIPFSPLKVTRSAFLGPFTDGTSAFSHWIIIPTEKPYPICASVFFMSITSFEPSISTCVGKHGNSSCDCIQWQARAVNKMRLPRQNMQPRWFSKPKSLFSAVFPFW